jgi:hypothetical protein
MTLVEDGGGQTFSGEGPQGAPPLALEVTREQLASFLTANPRSTLEEIESRSGKRIGIKMPWGDESLVIIIPDELGPLAEALNNVYLPERFTAIWHKDTRDLEIIYTAYSIRLGDLRERRWTFKHRGREYQCDFSAASERLLLIAGNAEPISESITQYRNLFSFHVYMEQRRATTEEKSYSTKIPIGDPICFWIRDIEWHDDQILDLVNHLNFYMSYFDTRCPLIVVHSPKLENAFAHRPRYIADRFPSYIASRVIDDSLLHFWSASRGGDPARRFLYSYRIVEYASFYYLEMGARSTIRKLLGTPNALDSLDQVAEGILGAVQDMKLSEPQKFEAVLRDTVAPALLWKEIARNIGAFSTETRFDGGFSVAPIAKLGWDEADFAVSGIAIFAAAVRNIRNALTHGRDQRTTAVITPTTHNFERLQPWASLMSVAAAEVMVFKDLG